MFNGKPTHCSALRSYICTYAIRVESRWRSAHKPQIQPLMMIHDRCSLWREKLEASGKSGAHSLVTGQSVVVVNIPTYCQLRALRIRGEGSSPANQRLRRQVPMSHSPAKLPYIRPSGVTCREGHRLRAQSYPVVQSAPNHVAARWAFHELQH